MRPRKASEPPRRTALDVRDGRGALIGRIWREEAGGVVTYVAVHRCGRGSRQYGSEVLARRWLEKQEARYVRL